MVSQRIKEYAQENYIALFIIFSLFYLVLDYVVYVRSEVLISDQWLYFPLLEKYYQGNFVISDLWASHSGHVKPGYKLVFLLNAIFFGLNTYAEIIVGVLFLLMSAFVLYQRFHASIKDHEASRVFTQISFGFIALILFSFNQRPNFDYSVLSLAGYVGMFLILIVYFIMDKILVQGVNVRRVAGLCFVLFFTLLTFAGGRGQVLIYSLIMMLGLKAILDRGISKELKILFVALMATIIVAQFLYWGIGTGAKLHTTKLGNSMELFLTDPMFSVQYFLIALTTSFLNVSEMRVQGASWLSISIIGVFILCAYVLAVWLFFRKNMKRDSYFPLFLILYAVLYIIATYMQRSYLGFSGSAGAKRYVFNTHLGLVGCAWIFVYALVVTKYDARKKWILWGTLAVVIVPVEYSITKWQTGKTADAWRDMGRHAVWQVQNRNFGDSPPWYCSSPERFKCMEKTYFLEEHKLNVFR